METSTEIRKQLSSFDGTIIMLTSICKYFKNGCAVNFLLKIWTKKTLLCLKKRTYHICSMNLIQNVTA